MGLMAWEKSRVKNLDLWDIGLIKLTVLAFTLLIVKFWPAIASLDWYWYLIVLVVAAIRPVARFLR